MVYTNTYSSEKVGSKTAVISDTPLADTAAEETNVQQKQIELLQLKLSVLHQEQRLQEAEQKKQLTQQEQQLEQTEKQTEQNEEQNEQLAQQQANQLHVQQLKQRIQQLKQHLQQVEQQVQQTDKKRQKQLLCVWFTTFKNATNRKVIQTNTLMNWSRFLPRMQPILFTFLPSEDYEHVAADVGWKVYPVPAVNMLGTPFLKDMVSLVTNSSDTINSTFYGYVNGDILFDDTLYATLQAVAENIPHLPPAPILITGCRTNFEFRSNDSMVIRDFFIVEEMRKRGALFRTDAEDYFFFTRDFPWNAIKRIVIGRPAYDNYLVAMARRLNVTVIDATYSLTALHQMAHKEGNEAGSKNPDGDFNRDVIGEFNYYDGMTNTARYETIFDEQRMSIVIKDRILNKVITP